MLKKKEIVYREVLSKALEEKIFSFTQLSLSKKFGFSLSTVNNAIKPLEEIGAVQKKQRSFMLADAKKALLFWASERSLRRDILYTTRSEMPVVKIEGSMPSGVVFTAYSAYRMIYNEAPADYSEVYVYADKKTAQEIIRRFPKRKGPENVFVLEGDRFLFRRKKTTAPLPQVFVDLWNLREWYASDFANAIIRRLNL